jgi:2-methylcitrate dehydratase PrpD
MAPDSKLLTAAEPTLSGLRAARLAAAGVTGPLDVLEHRQGFFDGFSYAPLRHMLTRLGETWTTRTLCVKPYPGCAYVDTTIDSLLAMELPDANEVDRVVVRAGLLTCGMDAMSNRYAAGRPTPVTVNFSIPLNVAIVLLAGQLTPDEVNDSWLDKHRDELESLRRRVSLHHDRGATKASAASFAPLLPVRQIVGDAGRRRLLDAGRRLRRAHHG